MPHDSSDLLEGTLETYGSYQYAISTLALMFRGSGFGPQLQKAQTRPCGNTQNRHESGWGPCFIRVPRCLP